MPDDACAVDTGVIHEQARDAYEAAGHEYLARVLRGEGVVLLHAEGVGGQHRKALCPLHVENTPSFCVPDGKDWWHCFGCGRSGNVVKFIERRYGLSYADAQRWLAGHYPIERAER